MIEVFSEAVSLFRPSRATRSSVQQFTFTLYRSVDARRAT